MFTPVQPRPNMAVIPYPGKPGFWTIQIGSSIYGCHARRDLAIAIMLTYNGS